MCNFLLFKSTFLHLISSSVQIKTKFNFWEGTFNFSSEKYRIFAEFIILIQPGF